MNIEIKVKGPGEKPVDIKTIDRGIGFQLTKGEDYTIYIMDSWDDDYIYAVNTSTLLVQTLNKAIMVYPVQIKSVKLEIELV